MTIHDFEWNYFCETFHEMSGVEIATYVFATLAWLCAFMKTRRSRQTDGVSLGFVFFTIVACAFGLYYQLFANMTVALVAYIAIFVLALAQFALIVKLRRAGAADERRRDLEARRATLTQSSQSSHKHSHEHSHSHSSSHSHGDGRRHGDHKHSRSGATSGEAKDPMYDDPLQEESGAADKK